jgi:hypothetical protein
MTAGPAFGLDDFVGTVGAMVAIAVGVLCGYLLVASIRPLYQLTVEPALGLIPLQLRPSHWGSIFGSNRDRRDRGTDARPDEPGA